MYKQISALIGNNEKTIYRWKKENRLIIHLLEKYFTEENLEEFLATQKIEKFEKFEKIQNKVINANANRYINTFLQKTQSNTFKFANPYFFDFYFSFLKDFNNIDKVSSKPFNIWLNEYFIEYAFKMDISIAKTMSSYLYLFSDWDELMSLFLSVSIEDQFKTLFETDDFSLTANEFKKEEVYLHAIGLYVYQNYSDLNMRLKVELVKNLTDLVKDKFFTFELLIEYLDENIKKSIDVFKEIY